MEEKDVQRLLDMLYGMIDEAKSVAFSSDKCIIVRDEALDLLDEIRTKYDLSILLSTHDFATLERYTDKVILLQSSVLTVGTPEEVLSSDAFRDVFHLDMRRGGC